MTLESYDGDFSDHDESGTRTQEAANPFKALGGGALGGALGGGAGAGLLSMIKRSVVSLHHGFKHCGKEKGKVFAQSGAAATQDFNLKLNTLSSDGDGDWGEKL